MNKIIERPALFNAKMVRAILDDIKTNTRRPVNRLSGFGNITEFQKSDTEGYDWSFRDKQLRLHDITHARLLELCPFGKVGDRLWVRETWQGPLLSSEEVTNDYLWYHYPEKYQNIAHCQYKADGGPTPEYSDPDDNFKQGWRPSIHMPRWASRITLEITNVRVERLQDISDKDAIAEGFKCLSKDRGQTYKYGIADKDGFPGNDDFGWQWSEWESKPKAAFKKIWKSIYPTGVGSWDANPWVWVITFKRVVK